ncbi:MAG: transglutaminase domain-containing protein [Armatimonadetes bacterium]|nr:transglutaminase domain-containing protein [Armatimonadota bacterium]
MKAQHGATFFDHLLVIISSSTALLALGESLGRHNLAAFLSIGAIVSVLIGYGISRKVAGTKIAEYDSYMWAGLALIVTVFARPLNTMLPDEGFPFILFAGTWLSWMILLCGLVSWRDQTLLFLNLPCLTVFALVGTFDTYPPATLLFFLFLVCSSLLYARIHKRSMQRRAMVSGIEEPELLERDAWRWMAGPEWAFASAGVIVLVSLLGAPVLRFSLQNVSGAVHVTLPQAPQPTASQNPGYQTLNDVLVGRGAVTLDPTPAFRVKMNRPDYLRGAIYPVFGGDGWSRLRSSEIAELTNVQPRVLGADRRDHGPSDEIVGWPNGVPLEPIKDPVTNVLELAGPLSSTPLFAPGPVVKVYYPGLADIMFTVTGTAYKRSGLLRGSTIKIAYLQPSKNTSYGPAQLPSAARAIEHTYLDSSRLSSRVREFAAHAVEGATTDIERADRLKKAIENAAGYTLKPPALMLNGDAVGQFLFDTKQGYCDLFASSMAACARAVGLPSRYVTGFIIQQPKPDEDGFYTVRNRDAHAWAEIYFENKGWVVFDPTDGAVSLDDTGATAQEKPLYSNPWLIAGAGAIVLFGLAFGQRLLRRVLALRAENTGTAWTLGPSLAREFDRIVRSKTAVTRRFSQTTAEYAKETAHLLGPDGEGLALKLVPVLEAACFGPTHLSDEEAADVRNVLKTLKKLKVERSRR